MQFFSITAHQPVDHAMKERNESDARCLRRTTAHTYVDRCLRRHLHLFPITEHVIDEVAGHLCSIHVVASARDRGLYGGHFFRSNVRLAC